MCNDTTSSPCTDAGCRRPAILQKEFANNDAKDQHRDQVGYRRLRCKGWCINWHWWRSHAWWLLRWRWRCWWVRWRGTGNLAQSDAFLLHMHLSTSISSQLRHHIRHNHKIAPLYLRTLWRNTNAVIIIIKWNLLPVCGGNLIIPHLSMFEIYYLWTLLQK